MVRAPFYDENGVKKGAWSEEEDEKLKAYVEINGHCNWRELPRLAGLSRCGKSCRLRWINYLRPDVKRGNYSKEEEELILKLHQEIGNKWSLIAAKMPGRTDNEIKNFWHTRLKKLNKTKVTKKQLKEASNSKPAIQTRQSDMTVANEIIPSNQIFESSPLSPLSSELSNVCSNLDSISASSTDMVAEDSPPMFSFSDSEGDFWADPFVSVSEEVQSEEPMYFSSVGGFMNPVYNLLFDNDEDLIYQVMKELPENYQSQFHQ